MRVIRVGRNSGNSSYSRGDTEAGGQRWTGVRRSAVYESAHTQQTPLKLHEETWEGLFRNQGPKIFREVEIVPGCAVKVACPSCPDYSPEPPGPGRVIRNMLGWSQLEKTRRSGVWVFRGAFQGKNIFLPLTLLETGKRSCRTAQRGRSPVIPHALVRMRMGKARYRATHWRAVLATASVESYRTPDAALVC